MDKQGPRRFVRWCRRERVLYWVLGVAAICGAVWFDHVSPAPASSSGFWSSLFANGVVFAVVRVAIIAASAYIVYSVLHNISRGLPLKEMAGARVAERVSTEATTLRLANENAVRERDAHKDRADRLADEVERLTGLLAAQAAENAQLQALLNPPLPGVEGGTISPEATQ